MLVGASDIVVPTSAKEKLELAYWMHLQHAGDNYSALTMTGGC